MNHIEVINNNSEQAVNNFEGLDWIYLDPARRDGAGKKVVALDDCEPNIVDLRPTLLEKAERIMVKCSPMLDITAACRQLRTVSDIHIVSVNNECKELLFILTVEECPAPTVHCINIKEDEKEQEEFISIKDEIKLENKIKIVDHINLNTGAKTSPSTVKYRESVPNALR